MPWAYRCRGVVFKLVGYGQIFLSRRGLGAALRRRRCSQCAGSGAFTRHLASTPPAPPSSDAPPSPLRLHCQRHPSSHQRLACPWAPLRQESRNPHQRAPLQQFPPFVWADHFPPSRACVRACVLVAGPPWASPARSPPESPLPSPPTLSSPGEGPSPPPRLRPPLTPAIVVPSPSYHTSARQFLGTASNRSPPHGALAAFPPHNPTAKCRVGSEPPRGVRVPRGHRALGTLLVRPVRASPHQTSQYEPPPTTA